MAKPKQRHREEEWRKYLLHIECVRRNAKYGEDYREWARAKDDEMWGTILRCCIAGRWGLVYDEPLPNPRKFPSLSSIMRNKLPPKGRVLKDDYGDPFERKGLDSITFFDSTTHLRHPALEGQVVMFYFPENSSGSHRAVLNLRLPKQTIMTEFEKMLDGWRKARKAAGLTKFVPERRFHLEEWVSQLKVYDLRNKGLKFAEIGENMWPGDKGDSEAKAKVCFTRAQYLIAHPPLVRTKL